MKKLVLSALSILVAATSVFGFAPLFTQAYDAEYLAAFDWAKDNGLTSMPDADAFGPYRNLTREEYSKFIGKFGQDFLCLEENPEADYMYDDDDQISPYLADSVVLASKLGLMRGSDGKFYPTTFVSKAQVLATLVRGMQDYMDETVSPWYANYHAYAYENGVTTVSDVNSFDRPVSRYEALLMLYRARNYDCDTQVIIPGDTGTVVNGDLTVTKSDSTLEKIYVPGTGNNIKIVELDLRAGSNGGSVKSIKFKLLPTLGSRANVKGISISDENGLRLTNVPTFNAQDEATVVFNNSNGFNVPANSTVKVRVLIDLKGSLNEILRFGIVEPTDIVSMNSTIGGNFPLVSSEVNTTQYSAQTIDFTAPASALVTPTNNVSIGDTNKNLGRFDLSTSNTSSRDVLVKSITFRSSRVLEGFIGNLKLETGTGVVSTTSVVDGKYVTFVFANNGYLMTRGTSKNFYIKGDVIGGDTNDEIQLYLDEARDLVALEEGTTAAVNVNITAGGTARFFGPAYAYKIIAGRTQISRTDTLFNTNIPTDEDAIQVLKANFNAKTAMNVEKFRVYTKFNGSNTCITANADADIERARLYINGYYIDEDPTASISANGCEYEFAFYGQLNAGANEIDVRIDTQKNASITGSYQFSVLPESIYFGSNAEYVSNGDTVQLADINGSAVGSIMYIKKAAVDSVALANPANPQTEVLNGDMKAIEFNLRASNVSDLFVNGFKLNLVAPGTNPGYVGSAQLWVNGQIVETEDFSNSQAVTFNSLGVLVPKGSSTKFTVMVKTYDNHPNAATTTPWDAQYSVNNWDIVDTKGNTVSYGATLNGNLIDVKGSVNVDGNLSNSVATSIIPDSVTDYVKVGAFTLRTDYNNAMVREIAMVNLSGAFTGTTVNGSGLGCSGSHPAYTTPCTNASSAADGMMVQLRNGTTVLGEGQLINGVAYVIFSTPVEISSSVSKTMDVFVKGNNTITNASETNKVIKLGLLNTNQTVGSAGATTQTLVTPVNSTVAISSTFNNIILNAHYVRDTKFVVAGTNVTAPLNVNTPSQTLFKTDFVVDNAGEAYLHGFEVAYSSNFSLTTGGLSALKLKIDGVEVNASDVAFTTGASIIVTLSGSYTNGFTLSPGTHNIEVLGTVNAGALSSSSTENITFYIPERATQASCGTIGTAASWTLGTNASIVRSDGAHSTYSDLATTADWFNDCGIETLQSNYYKLQD
jgi:hypothetical protein